MPAVAFAEPQPEPIVLTLGTRELVCDCCGYGIVAKHGLPECPMCRSRHWRERRRGQSLRSSGSTCSP